MNDVSQTAAFHTLQSFLTSYLVDCRAYQIIKGHAVGANPKRFDQYDDILVLHETIFIPLHFKSATNFHVYSLDIYQAAGNDFFPLTFEELVEKICCFEEASKEEAQLFISRVVESLKTIETSLSSPKELIEASTLDFKTSEQSLIFGHFSHPYPKLQEQDHTFVDFNFTESLNLIWCLAAEEILHCEHSQAIAASDIRGILKSIYGAEMMPSPLIDDIPESISLFPIHAAQFEHLKTLPIIQRYISEKKLLPLKGMSATTKWIPTTSLRTLYNENSPWMLKFSLNVRLTNSVRILQDNEVRRGIQVHEVFHSPKAKTKFSDKETSPLIVIHEPLFLAIKDENQHIINSSIVVLRENPFLKTGANKTICLAVLNQPLPHQKESLLSLMLTKKIIGSKETYEEVALNWFEAFLTATVIPLVLLQARYGLYFGAHQQNLILQLNEEGFPERSFYRDCQGTGYSEFGFKLFKDESPSLNMPNGNVLPVEFANTLMGYYLFINSTLFTIRSLANGNLSLELKLLTSFKEKLSALTDVQDRSFIDYILNSKKIFIKDNFECCLRNMNENLIANPLSIYKEMCNPFVKEIP